MATAEPISPVSTTDVNLHETAEPSHNDAQFMRDLETASPWKPNDEPGDCPERAVNSNLVEAADVDTNTATAGNITRDYV
jgi:hypothetical protein